MPQTHPNGNGHKEGAARGGNPQADEKLVSKVELSAEAIYLLVMMLLMINTYGHWHDGDLRTGEQPGIGKDYTIHLRTGSLEDWLLKLRVSEEENYYSPLHPDRIAFLKAVLTRALENEIMFCYPTTINGGKDMKNVTALPLCKPELVEQLADLSARGQLTVLVHNNADLWVDKAGYTFVPEFTANRNDDYYAIMRLLAVLGTGTLTNIGYFGFRNLRRERRRSERATALRELIADPVFTNLTNGNYHLNEHYVTATRL